MLCKRMPTNPGRSGYTCADRLPPPRPMHAGPLLLLRLCRMTGSYHACMLPECVRITAPVRDPPSSFSPRGDHRQQLLVQPSARGLSGPGARWR